MTSPPLSITALNWIHEHGEVDADWLTQHFENQWRDQRIAISLRPYYAEIQEVFNDLTAEALQSNPYQKSARPSCDQLTGRLHKKETLLPDRLREKIPSITDEQIEFVSNVYHGWRHRIQAYARQLTKQETPQQGRSL